MSYKLPKIEIPNDNPFKNCKLNRRENAEVLETIVSTYKEGGVLALNGKWGTGKTTFVRMWQKYLKQKNITTLYFNAWESDFIIDPLIGLLGELNQISSNTSKVNISSVLNVAGKIILNAAPSIAKGVVEHYCGTNATSVIREVVDGGASLLKEEIDKYEKQTETLKQFHKALSHFVESNCNGKPLVFIVDELDRCNPHYAVKVLERIKHIFDIPNIVFVLSIDKVQLGNSIRGYYGSNWIDADEYLKRFIDIEYTLPDPDANLFCDYLYDHYDFHSYLSLEKRAQYYNANQEKDVFLSTAQILFKERRLTLRQVEKIFNNTRLAINMFNVSQIFYPDLFFLLTYLRICENDIYEKICRNEYSIGELVNKIETLISKDLLTSNNIRYKHKNRNFLFTIALLIKCYNRNSEGQDNENVLIKNEQNQKFELAFSIKNLDNNKLIEILEMSELYTGKIVCLTHFTNKINLLDNFNGIL